MDWQFVEGDKRYQARFAETLLATHADLAARKLTPDAPNNKNQERHRLHEKMEREGSASADITLRTSIRMSDEAGKGEGRGQRCRPRPGMAGPACRLPVPEPYHAGPFHRDARPYRRRGRAPAHRLLGGRPDREPHLRGRVQLPGDGSLRRPAFLHARRGAARVLHRRGSAPHRLYALPAGAGGSAHRGHRQPGGEG